MDELLPLAGGGSASRDGTGGAKIHLSVFVTSQQSGPTSSGCQVLYQGLSSPEVNVAHQLSWMYFTVSDVRDAGMASVRSPTSEQDIPRQTMASIPKPRPRTQILVCTPAM